MSTFLYRLGRFGYSRPWAFIGLWAAVLGIVFGAIGLHGGKISDSVTIEGTPSQQVLDTPAGAFPRHRARRAASSSPFPRGSASTPPSARQPWPGLPVVYDNDLVVNPAEQAAAAAKQAQESGPDAAQALEAQQEAAQKAARRPLLRRPPVGASRVRWSWTAHPCPACCCRPGVTWCCSSSS